jgi:WD repeat-containing protein mio
MHFEPPQTPQMLGPMLVQQALSDIPIFGEHKADIEAIIQKTLRHHHPVREAVLDTLSTNVSLPESFYKSTTVADKLRELRSFSKEVLQSAAAKGHKSQRDSMEKLAQSMDDLSTNRTGPPSNRQLHERLLASTLETSGFPREAQVVLDNVALLRANEKYLFDSSINRDIVSDDPWLRDMWDWIAGSSGSSPMCVSS